MSSQRLQPKSNCPSLPSSDSSPTFSHHFPEKMSRKRKARVREVLWTLFRDRVRTLGNTIMSLLPPPRQKCQCKGSGCLGCNRDPFSFLIRPNDCPDYRRLLTQTLVVVSENAPRLIVFSPECNWPQNQVVKRTVEIMLHEQPACSNVLCSGYNKSDHSSQIIGLLSSSSWGILLQRGGDDLMVYLLKYTSIFLPLPKKNHQQVTGPPISTLCCDLPKQSSKIQYGIHKKRKGCYDVDSVVERKQCRSPSSIVNFSMNTSCQDENGSLHSVPLINHCVNGDYQMASPEGLNSIGGTNADINKENLNGGFQQSSRCSSTLASNLGKNSRPFRWQRWRKRRKLSSKELDSNYCSKAVPTLSDYFPGNLKDGEKSYLKMPSKCVCAVSLPLSTVPKRALINRKPMFYKVEYPESFLPRKHVLHSLKPNLASSKFLFSKIFGSPEANTDADKMQCFQNTGHGCECLYQSLVKSLKTLLYRTRCCQHMKLLDKHCPVPWSKQSVMRNSSCSLEDVKDKMENKFNGKIGSQFGGVDYYCSKSQVVSFIWAICRSVIPHEFLGTCSNMRAMRRNIFKFIRLRRFERFSIKQCLCELKTSKFPFLSNKYFMTVWSSHGLENAGSHISSLNEEINSLKNVANFMKQKLLERWVFWFFSHMVVPLVRANFYVTETEHGNQDVYYYRQSVWQKLTDGTISYLQEQRYIYLDDVAVRNILRGRSFGFSKLRLLPKENGVRMVANLKGFSRMPLHTSSTGVHSTTKQGKTKFGPKKVKYNKFCSVNFVLRDAHAILRGLQLQEPDKLGASVFDYNDVYRKLCPFLLFHKNGLKNGSGFFIVISDVSKAFDSINQDKLLTVINDVVHKDDYSLQQYDQVACRNKSLWVKKHLTLPDESTCTDTGFVSSSLFRSRHTIILNQGSCKLVKKELLFSNIQEHVKHNVLQLDGKFYLQGVGIPQGGILSSLLCSLYFGHLEKNVIFPFLEKSCEFDGNHENPSVPVGSEHRNILFPSYILLRLIDDFLFISTSKKQAASLFSRLRRGFRDYNCYMNEKKFGVNFDSGQLLGISSSRFYSGEDGSSFLRWSGLLINCHTMDILADYSKYLKNHLRSTLTVCWHGKQGFRLKQKLCSFMRPKCHPIFFDSNINSAAVVRLNIYQAFLLCAMKFHCYISELSYVCWLPKRSCLRSIEEMFSYMYKLVRRRMRTKCGGADIRPVLELDKGEVQWLGLHAYVHVLKRKQSRHRELLSSLRSKLLAHKLSGSMLPQLEYAVDSSHSSLLWKIPY